MRAILVILIGLLLAACGPSQDTVARRYIGHWTDRTNPKSELDIVQRTGADFTLIWTQTYGSDKPTQTRKSFDATLVGEKLVSQGFTTFLVREDVLVFANAEFIRGAR